MAVHCSRLASLEEPITPFEKVIARHGFQWEVYDRIAVDDTLEAPLGCASRVVPALATQIRNIGLQSSSNCRTLDVPDRRAD
jgi:hypothetical protein